MIQWLKEKEREGHEIKLRAGSVPIHPDWLARGWTAHVRIDERRLGSTDGRDCFAPTDQVVLQYFPAYREELEEELRPK